MPSDAVKRGVTGGGGVVYVDVKVDKDWMMLPNPYTPGQPARVLSGLAREKARISERLERVAAIGDYGGPLLVFHSPRGIGKTSLLRSAEP